MNRTYICDRCPRVAVVVENEMLFCGDCFLQQTVRRVRAERKEERKPKAA